MRCVFELSSGCNRSSRSAASLHAQVFGEASSPVINDWLICLVHFANPIVELTMGSRTLQRNVISAVSAESI